MTPVTVDYGRCLCGGRYDQRFVEVRLPVADPAVTLTNVSQGACPNCGGRVYKADTLERIETLFRSETMDRRCNRPETWMEADCLPQFRTTPGAAR